MNFKKRVNGSWTDTPHYIHNTSTDTLTTLPAELYPNAETATVGLKGQAVQSSVPSPTSPVMPQGTGERTGNLAPPDWAEDFVQRINNSAQAYINNDILRILASAGYEEYDIKYIFKAEWKENTRYTFNLTYRRDSIYTNASMLQITYTDGTATQFPRTINDGEWHTIYITSGVGKTIKYLNVWYSSNWLEIKIDSFFVYEGTVRKPYEPYGIKIPISSAGQTTPVYLGEVETTRRIKKLVFDGTENWQLNNRIASVGGKYFNLPIVTQERTEFGKMLCSHYPVANPYDRLTACCVMANYSRGIDIRVNNPSTESNIDNFKAYLAAQYAAGTPVTVWYALTTEETAVVNEPLMKIGDYADTLSNVSIPVTAGGDTLSVGTTVQPSEVTVNYKGWHPVADVHERDDGVWT